jgi:hypothetical protein
MTAVPSEGPLTPPLGLLEGAGLVEVVVPLVSVFAGAGTESVLVGTSAGTGVDVTVV